MEEIGLRKRHCHKIEIEGEKESEREREREREGEAGERSKKEKFIRIKNDTRSGYTEKAKRDRMWKNQD